MFDLTRLLKTISPKIGLNVVTKHLIDAVGHPVEKYEMRFYADINKIDFLVYHPGFCLSAEGVESLNYPIKYQNDRHCHLYNFTDGTRLAKIVNMYLKNNLDNGQTLDFAVIKYEDGYTIDTFYRTREGEKKKSTLKL